MKILVTGGAGFIGSHIIDKALEAGHEVAALDDLSSGKKENIPSGVHLYEVDIRDGAATLKAFRDFRPDAVSHQAAQASVSVSMKDPALDAAINIIGGIRVVEASLDVGAGSLVFASTGGAIYGEIAEGLADENHGKDPISAYAIDKLAFEQILAMYERQADLRPTVLRYANVYGPRQDPHGEAGVVAIFLNRLLAQQKIQVNAMRHKGDAGCIRDYIYVGDVARANVLALEGKLDVSLMNLGTGVGTTTRELARSLVTLARGGSVMVDGDPRLGDVERSVLDGSLALSKLGPFISLDEGLKLTAEWFRQRAPAQ
jgi:UDP-glucose 4-epimerase